MFLELLNVCVQVSSYIMKIYMVQKCRISLYEQRVWSFEVERSNQPRTFYKH